MKNTPRQIVLGIAWQNWDRCLGEDGAGVHFLGYQVDGTAMQLHTGGQRSGVGVQARK